mmetsp:Transcript_53397/g.127213  ORF Transcript_53397/g.127213 Transcript_53397/m.127213 type:complete len:203 (-) Transcript_53397:77-685(-)
MYSARHRAPTDMPKRGRSCVFFPRRKEGEHAEPGPLTRHIIVNYETLANLFHLPLKDAARELGLCPTTFKKACRCFNLERWPFRKGQSRIPLARRDSTSSIDSSTSTVRASSELPRDCPDPFSAMFSSVAPEGLLQQSSMALDTRSSGEARSAGPAFQHKTFAPPDAPSYREQSCVEAVMEYLDGPLAENFDFMFADEEGAP